VFPGWVTFAISITSPARYQERNGSLFLAVPSKSLPVEKDRSLAALVAMIAK